MPGHSHSVSLLFHPIWTNLVNKHPDAFYSHQPFKNHKAVQRFLSSFFITKIPGYFKLWQYFLNKLAPTLPASSGWCALLWNNFSNASCYPWCCGGMSVRKQSLIFNLVFLRGVHFLGRELNGVGDGAAVFVWTLYKSSPVCLFLRWLIQGAELGVGLLPLGRNRAAPFTARKLSLILEDKRNKTWTKAPDIIFALHQVIAALLLFQ